MNPSIASVGDLILMIQRSVNFTLTDDGRYETPDDGPVRTRNFLLRLDRDLNTLSGTEILPPADLPDPAFGLVLGFEDARLFFWADGLWCSSTVRELTREGWCEQVLARIDRQAGEPCRLMNWRVMVPDGAKQHEKNWMPQVEGATLRFLYSCDPTRVVDEHGRMTTETTAPVAAEPFRGGSQMISFCGGWLALIHEVSLDGNARRYQHRFVWFDTANTLRRVSLPFFFHTNGIEYAAGLAWHPDR